MKKIGILLIGIISISLNSATYKVKIEEKHTRGYIQKEIQFIDGWSNSGINQKTGTLYDEEGWSQSGINEETGTQYDKDGYNKEGFGVDGFTKEECKYNGEYTYTRTYVLKRDSSTGNPIRTADGRDYQKIYYNRYDESGDNYIFDNYYWQTGSKKYSDYYSYLIWEGKRYSWFYGDSISSGNYFKVTAAETETTEVYFRSDGVKSGSRLQYMRYITSPSYTYKNEYFTLHGICKKEKKK